MSVKLLPLLPSKALRARIREENHVFSEKDTLLILYRYARTQKERLALLAEFAEIASEAYAAIARHIAAWEEEKLVRFMEPTEGFVYEISVKNANWSAEERCLCDSYGAAIASIDAFYANYDYTDGSMTRKEFDRWEISKMPVTTKGQPWPETTPACCLVDADGLVLSVEDNSDWAAGLTEELGEAFEDFTPYDFVEYPFFVEAGQLVRYTEDHYPSAKVEYGICPYDFDRTLCSHVYVYPLNSDAVRFSDTSMAALTCAHEHIDAPLCDIVTPDELPDGLRRSAATFWAAFKASSD